MSGDSLFFYGTLQHQPLLRLVLGADSKARLEPARLPGHAVHWASGQSFPMIRENPDAEAGGLLARDLSGEDIARLDFYEGGFDYALRPVTVTVGGSNHAARVYFPAPGTWRPGALWSLDDWQRNWGAISMEAAAEVMSYYGKLPADEVARRFPMIRIRAASRVRARPAPAELRARYGPGDIETIRTGRPYSNYFTLEEHDLRFRRYDGTMSPKVTRAGFVGGDAVTVLPYDPERDRVLVIEQFRFGPHLRGDARPWVLEPIAGRIDPGESPEACARREALEEARLTLGALHHIADYYPSPGAVSEFLYSWLAIADLPDSAAGLGGAAHEDEDIRAHVIGFDRLMDLVTSGEAGCGPLVLSALWLAQNRARLRAGG